MIIDLSRVDVNRTAVRFTTRDPLFDAVKMAVRAVPGRTWEGDAHRWVVPTAHVTQFARALVPTGAEFSLAPEYEEELFQRNRARERMAEWQFRDHDPDWVQPPLLTTALRGYQQSGVRALRSVPGGTMLADPAGTGKTLTAMADHELAGYRTGPNSILWLVQAGLRYNVLNQYRLHTGLSEDELAELVVVVDGPAKRRAALWQHPAPIKICGYELFFQRDWLAADAPLRWNKVYADEFTKVKNRRAVAHRRMRDLRVESGITGMTATPLETNLRESYNLYDLLQPGVLGIWPQFRDRFMLVEEDRRGVVRVVGHNPEMVQTFSEEVAPLTVRRPKSLLLPQLPPKQPIPLDLVLTDQEMRWYRQMADEFLRWILLNDSDSANNPLTQMLRLRQFLNSPNAVSDDYPVVGTKMQALLDVLDERSDTVVVFTQWTETLERIAASVNGALHGRQLAVASGAVSAHDKFELTQRVNVGEPMVLVTTDSMAYGFDLYGASAMVHYDCLWNPAKMLEQREGRLHRGDQRERVDVYTMRALNTIEEVVQFVMEQRADLAASIERGTRRSQLRQWNNKQWKDALAGRWPS